jgi:peptidyl-prolyl cis-trans isomerase B (cyclophilin B)
MVIALWPEVAPNTVENFRELANAGFYDGTAFHRIMKGFMVQAGCPLTKDPARRKEWGTGGPGYTIRAEFNDRPHVRGVISMARGARPDSAGSQFFICLAEARFLDGQYTAFGQLAQGDVVLSRIGATPTVAAADGERSQPIVRVGIESVRVISGQASQR